jgi:hypothetical protein
MDSSHIVTGKTKLGAVERDGEQIRLRRVKIVAGYTGDFPVREGDLFRKQVRRAKR